MLLKSGYAHTTRRPSFRDLSESRYASDFFKVKTLHAQINGESYVKAVSSRKVIYSKYGHCALFFCFLWDLVSIWQKCVHDKECAQVKVV